MKKLIAILKAANVLPAEAPEWWQVIPYGEVFIVGENEPKIMDDIGAEYALKYFKMLGRDMVIDYEHQTLENVQAPAAGWIKELEWRGTEGLWAKTEWTDKASEYIRNKEYRYFSPVFIWRESDKRVIALVNVALTNEPRTRNIKPIAAKLEVLNNPEKRSEIEDRLNKLEDILITGENKKEKLKMDFIKKLAALLKLKSGATEDEIYTAVNSLFTKAAKTDELEEQLKGKDNVIASKAIMEALKLDANSEEKIVVAKINSLSAGDKASESLATEVETLKGKILDMETADLTGQALKNGQTSPEELEAWGTDLARTDPEKFKKIVLKREPGSVVPIKGLKKKTVTVNENGLSDIQVSINKQVGITDEVYKEFGPKEEDEQAAA